MGNSYKGDEIKADLLYENKTQGQYVNVYRDILKNNNLSLRDRGMIVTLLSLPDNWDLNIAGLSKIIPDGKSAIRASLAHLEELGYVSRGQERNECGKFERNVIEIHDTPVEPQSNFPQAEKPQTERRR